MIRSSPDVGLALSSVRDLTSKGSFQHEELDKSVNNISHCIIQPDKTRTEISRKQSANSRNFSQ